MPTPFTSQPNLPSFYNLPTIDFTALPLQNLIQNLKNDPSIIGVSHIHDLQGNALPIYIKLTRHSRGTARFVAYTILDHQIVGTADIEEEKYLSEQSEESTYFYLGLPEELKGYGHEGQNIEKVYLNFIRNSRPDKYKNVGVMLLHFIFNFYDKSCDGRIMLQALSQTGPYHYKNGFRAADLRDEHLHSLFEKAAFTKEPLDHESIYMILPDSSRQTWRQAINEHQFIELWHPLTH